MSVFLYSIFSIAFLVRFRGVIPHQASFLALDFSVCESCVVWYTIYIVCMYVFFVIFLSFFLISKLVRMSS